MKQELKNLFDKKGKIVNEMQDAYRDVNKRGGVATPEERAKFDGWDKELTEIQEQIDFHQRAAKLDLINEAHNGVKLESEQNKEKKFKDDATKLERRNAIDKAKVHGYTSLNDEERIVMDTELRDQKVFEKFLRSGFNKLNAQEQQILTRAQQYSTRIQKTLEDGLKEYHRGRFLTC